MTTTTQQVPASRTIPAWLKAGLVSTFVILLCWSAAIAYWRSTERTPSGWELGLLLLGVPLLLLTSIWLIPKALPQRQTVQAKASGEATVPTTTAEGTPLAILAAALRTPHGATLEDVSAAVSKKKSSADPDPELLDGDGLPVMTARVKDGFDEALFTEIQDWLTQDISPDPGFSHEQLRALTLGSSVLTDLATVASQQSVDAPLAKPQLRLLLPPTWTAEQRRATGMWLAKVMTDSGWPDISISTEDSGVPGVLAHFAQQAQTSKEPVLTIVLAFESSIGEQTVARWAEAGTLFTPSNPRGATPGEGAAGLLIGDQRAVASYSGAGAVAIRSLNEACRAISADGSRKVDATCLTELADRSLNTARASAAEVRTIVADTGARSNRVLELMAYANRAVPEIDETEDILHAGSVCGTCGQVSFMSVLALAYHHASAHESPVLAISCDDDYRRVVAVLGARPLHIGEQGSNPAG